MNKKIRHLEMLQKIINRMGQNSFYLKGWTITLIAASFAASRGDWGKSHLFTVLVIVGAFWLLDAYYLQLERKYRKLYDYVRALPEDDVDFSMDIRQAGVSVEETKKLCFLSCMFSTSEICIYLLLIVVIFTWRLFFS